MLPAKYSFIERGDPVAEEAVSEEEERPQLYVHSYICTLKRNASKNKGRRGWGPSRA
jgi:hypothetical protein